MRIVTVIGAAIVLAACGTAEFSVPVTGQLSDGTAAAGTATARIDGKGAFWVKVPNGWRCSGSYDSLTKAPSIVVPVSCDDGRSGEAVITRQMDMMSGAAIVTLADGAKGQFVFGNLTFDQAYGEGAARTITTQPVRIVQ